MQLAFIFFLALTLQSSRFEGPVMIHCQVDTELPLEELRVSLTEKPELDEPIESDSQVTLSGLPEGDLHLSFFQNDERLGEIEVQAAQSRELIRLKIRLVSRNAILLDEYRIKGLSESSSSTPSPFTYPEKNTGTMGRSADGANGSSHCPPAGEAVSRTGRIARIIDHEAFQLQGDDQELYVIYVGSATWILEGSIRLANTDLQEGMRMMIRGAVAAGPTEECSIGARRIVVQRP